MALSICLNFDGDFTVRTTFDAAPPTLNFDPSEASKIMRITLPIDGSVLMGADVAKGFGEPYAPGNNFSISYSPSSKEKADHVFDSLSDGGTVIMLMDTTFWGSYFGICKNKFGIKWMMNVPPCDLFR